MKESKESQCLTLSTGKVTIRQEGFETKMPFQKREKKHSKSEEQVRKVHTDEWSSEF